MRESKSWRRYFANGLVGDTMVKTVLLVKQGVEVKQGVVFDGKPHLLGKQAMAQSRQATSAGAVGSFGAAAYGGVYCSPKEIAPILLGGCQGALQEHRLFCSTCVLLLSDNIYEIAIICAIMV